MRIALYQASPKLLDTAVNLAVMEQAARAAALQGARLLVFPELFLTGYNLLDDCPRVAEPADGASYRRLAALARETGIALLYGYPERADGVIYNSAQLIDQDGQALANYRKCHLFGPDERRLFRPGASAVTAVLDGLTLGILICYDVEFPEIFRTLVLRGADLVVVPTAIGTPYEAVPTTICRARAYENQVFVAYCNLAGEERGLGYFGMSGIIGPDGQDIARAGHQDRTLLVADIDPSAYAASRTANTYLRDRRPELYAAVAAGQ
jgi:predicted amidohydrolase